MERLEAERANQRGPTGEDRAGIEKELAKLEREMAGLEVSEARSIHETALQELADEAKKATGGKIGKIEVEEMTKEDSELLAAARQEVGEPVEQGVAQIENDMFFYQGEVIKDTETFHGTGTYVSKLNVTKFVGQFDHGKKCGDG